MGCGVQEKEKCGVRGCHVPDGGIECGIACKGVHAHNILHYIYICICVYICTYIILN